MAAWHDDHPERLRTASEWYAELQEPDLDHETWEAFAAWESDPANAAAFREIERSLVVLDRTGFGRPDSGGSHDGRGRRFGVWGAGLAAVLVLGLVVVALWPAGQEPVVPEVYVSQLGEVREVSLADGSSVTLNTDTQIEVVFSDTARDVGLVHGEALFDVAAGQRPFRVDTSGRVTEALGTVFSVRAGDTVAVTLVEGSVRVGGEASGQGRVLEPGQQLLVHEDGRQEVRAVDPAAVTRWQAGLVEFDNVTLEEAVAEMNRYSSVTIRIADAALAAERVSGTFPAGKQVEFVESLKLFLPVEAEVSKEEIVLEAVG
ncbi:FecR domain-containing protein [Henriciella sp.]|jgi:transmembrane sensor|uniref:FecR family protein n=1 Tax=Henriciella sp. TaxID=1968823 RepID=UPI00263320A6|nr:FecR domain-containing protein [Henriciella sp.]|tara:strand:+ start:2286 stop:3236 length:951 start_codon:yes stop_codon:yes gene_type:complete